jgi:hypothetical protein
MEIAGAGTSLGGDFIGVEQAGKLGPVVTRNQVKHTYDGDLYLRTLNAHGAVRVEVLAPDKGPDIQDGYSTAGTAGTGLGAVARLPDVYARWAPFRPGGVARAISAEIARGDGWLVRERLEYV